MPMAITKTVKIKLHFRFNMDANGVLKEKPSKNLYENEGKKIIYSVSLIVIRLEDIRCVK